jgi:hypothetical protein
MHCVCPLMPSISCLLCTVSFQSCCPSAIYHALCLFTHAAHMSTVCGVFNHAVHQLSTMHSICSLMLTICLPFAMSVQLCCPSAVYRALCLFTHAAPMSTVCCVFNHAVHQLSTMHSVCSLMLTICLPVAMSVQLCCPSAVYRTLCLFTHAVHQLSTTHCVHLCCPSTVYCLLCLFTHAVHQLSTMHCVCSLMLSISCLLCTVSVHSCCGVYSLIHHS